MSVVLAAPACESATAAPPKGRDVCAGSATIPNGFVPYERPARHFSIALPRLPKKGAPADEESETVLMVYEGDAVYLVHRGDFVLEVPAAKTEWALDKLRDGAASNVKGRVEREEPIRCGSYAGREVVIASAKGEAVCRARLFVAGSESFLVSFTSTPSAAKSPRAQAFLDTFRVLKAKP